MKIAEWVKRFRQNEPVRLLVIPVTTAVTGVLVAKGVLDSSTEFLVLAAVAAIVGVPLGEAIRSRVTPTSKVDALLDKAADNTAAVIDNVEKQAHDNGVAIDPAIQRYLDAARNAAEYFTRGDHTKS